VRRKKEKRQRTTLIDLRLAEFLRELEKDGPLAVVDEASGGVAYARTGVFAKPHAKATHRKRAALGAREFQAEIRRLQRGRGTK
jgi:hypothetical protein